MADLNISTTTFNCGRALIDVDHFAANLFNGLTSNLPPDLVVLSLQEIAPLGYSFLGGSLPTPYLERFTGAVNLAAAKAFTEAGPDGGQDGYESVMVRNVGMTAILVFARPVIEHRIRWVETAGVGVGHWEMGNKGGVRVRLAVTGADGDEEEQTVVTFVAAHLAPMDWDCERSNADLESICEGLVFERDGAFRNRGRSKASGPESEPLLSPGEDNDSDSNEESSLFSPLSHMFFFGDLNYRTSHTAPKPDDYKTWPQSFKSLSDVQEYIHLFEHDQLTREMKKGKTCHHLTESRISFPPTYKYSSAAQQAAAKGSSTTKTAIEGCASLWAKHKVPSWCDRILYLAAAPPIVHSYTALPMQSTSDHRPVSLSFSIPLKPLDLSSAEVKPPFVIRKDWREARAAAKRYELAVGLAAYLGLTWEGEALLAGTVFGVVGGYLVLRAMIGM